jgi:hypothetical protein
MDLAESLLARALLLPRVPPEDVPVRLAVFEAQFASMSPTDSKAWAEIGAAKTRYLDDQFGKPYAELKNLLFQDREDKSGVRMRVNGLIGHYLRKADMLEQGERNHALSLESWVGTSKHSQRRRKLVELLIEFRTGAWEAIRLQPDPDSPKRTSPVRPTWNRTPEGYVEVHFGGHLRVIKEPRWVWLFTEVAGASGIRLAWGELIRRLMHHEGEANVLSEETIKTYARSISDALHPFGDLFDRDPQGARWLGESALGGASP